MRDAPAGTAFTATQDGVTVRSQSWRGLVRATAPPRVEGTVRVGGFVRPLAATWQGGWGRETDWLQLQVCRTAAGADCLVILSHGYPCRPGGGRLLPARYEGRWLRVTDFRVDQSQPSPAIGYSAPEAIRPQVPNSAGIAGAVVGKIAPGPAPSEDCGHLEGLAHLLPVEVSRVVLRPTRLSLRVSKPVVLRVRIARRVGRPRAARWRRVRRFSVRAESAGRATRKLRRIGPGRYRITIRSTDKATAGFERAYKRTIRR